MAKWLSADKVQGMDTENWFGGTEDLDSQTKSLGDLGKWMIKIRYF